MSRTKRLLDSVVLNYTYQALVMAVGLWLTPFLLHRLGTNNYGVWLVGLQSLTYLSVLDLGVIGLLPREVAYLSGKVQTGADAAMVSALLEDNVTVVLWQTPVLITALTISFFVLRNMKPEVSEFMLIIFITYGAQFPLRIFYAALEGLQDFAFLGYLQMGSWAAGVAVNVALVIGGWGLHGLAIGWSAGQAITTFGSIWRMYARHSEFTPKRLRWLERPHLFKYFRSGFWVSVSQITQMLIKGSDVVLLASMKGPGAVVPFSCSTKLTSVLANQPQVILQAAQPGLTQLRATSDRDHIGEVIGSLAQAMLMLSGAVVCVVLAINGGFIKRWVGPAQYLGFTFTVLIAASMLARHWNTTTIYTLFCFGKERYISIIGLIDGAVFVVMTFFLVRSYGAIGVPIASIGSVCLVSLPSNFRVLKQVTGMTIWNQIAPVRQWLFPFLAAAFLSSLANRFYSPSSYLACAMTALAATAIYFALEFPVIRHSMWGRRLREMLAAAIHPISAFFKPRREVQPSEEPAEKVNHGDVP